MTSKTMSNQRVTEIVTSLSEFDKLVLDYYISLGDAPSTVWDVCEVIGVPRFVGGDVMRRLVGLGLLTTEYTPRPVWERRAVATEKGKAISESYNG